MSKISPERAATIARVRNYQAACGIPWDYNVQTAHEGLTDLALVDAVCHWGEKAAEVKKAGEEQNPDPKTASECRGGRRVNRKPILETDGPDLPQYPEGLDDVQD